MNNKNLNNVTVASIGNVAMATVATADLFLENLADPLKMKLVKQTAKIVDNNATDGEDSYVADMNNEINKNQADIDVGFNSDIKPIDDDKKHELSNKSKHSKPSRLSTRHRINSSSPHVANMTKKLEEVIKHNFDMTKFSDDVHQPPITNPINVQPPITQQINKPIFPSPPSVEPNKPLTAREIKSKKLECLAKLMYLKNIGLELTGTYNKDSDLEELEAELKYQTDLQSKKDGIGLCKSIMCNLITGTEYLNERYDPFGFKLKGWADQVKMNKDDFDTVFGELLDKYKGSGSKLEPEFKLAMMIGLSAVTYHTSQSLSTGMPQVDEVIKNNPELIAKLQSGVNKTISGPSEYDNKLEVHQHLKKVLDEKKKSSDISQNKQHQSPKRATVTATAKPTSVKNLLQNINKIAHLDSITENNNITIGDTVETENNTSEVKPSVSSNIKTKSHLAKKNKVQVKNE